MLDRRNRDERDDFEDVFESEPVADERAWDADDPVFEVAPVKGGASGYTAHGPKKKKRPYGLIIASVLLIGVLIYSSYLLFKVFRDSQEAAAEEPVNPLIGTWAGEVRVAFVKAQVQVTFRDNGEAAIYLEAPYQIGSMNLRGSYSSTDDEITVKTDQAINDFLGYGGDIQGDDRTITFRYTLDGDDKLTIDDMDPSYLNLFNITLTRAGAENSTANSSSGQSKTPEHSGDEYSPSAPSSGSQRQRPGQNYGYHGNL